MTHFSALHLKQITPTSVLISAAVTFPFLVAARLLQKHRFFFRFVCKMFLFAGTIILITGGYGFAPSDLASV